MRNAVLIVVHTLLALARLADAPAALAQEYPTRPITYIMPFAGGSASDVVEYKQGDTILEGYLAYDDAIAGKRPGVLVAHTYFGLNNFIRGRAEELAKMGYVAFAADIYGKGVRPPTVPEASQQSGIYGRDRPLTRLRAQAALDVLSKNPSVDTARIAVIGYCFGGMVALELARSGAPVAAAVSFHGTLSTPTPEDAKNIKGRVLVLHGADDPIAPQKQVDDFVTEMRNSKVAFDLELYSGVVHAFAIPTAVGPAATAANAYNERADRRSWAAMQALFAEVFGN
jgi:dienelactone hydrolase